jgi:hypothetical protein
MFVHQRSKCYSPIADGVARGFSSIPGRVESLGTLYKECASEPNSAVVQYVKNAYTECNSVIVILYIRISMKSATRPLN